MKAALISLGSTSSKWTLEAMRKYFDEVDDLDLKEMEVTVGREPQVLFQGNPLKDYDCVFAKGSFRYAPVLQSITTMLFGKAYMPIAPEAFTNVHDKFLTHLVLQKYGIPMPKTYITATLEAAKRLLKEQVRFPIVFKFPKGTGGKGVMFADSYSSASSILDALVALNQPLIIQEYIETGGEDVRLIVVGDQVAASYKRVANVDEKRANMHAGGRGETFEPDDNMKKIAIRTAQVLNAEILGVDMLISPKGPLIIEANLSPGLQGITGVTKIDVAEMMAKYLFDRTKERVDKAKDVQSKEIMDQIKDSPKNQVITTLDFRGNRIFLPEVITRLTKFNDYEDVVIEMSKGNLNIRKF